MMAYGYQGSLLGVRAVQEEFSLNSNWIYDVWIFCWILHWCTSTIPNLISRVGHIRVFAAFASLASLVILVHSIFINPLRLVYFKSFNGNKYGLYLYCS